MLQFNGFQSALCYSVTLHKLFIPFKSNPQCFVTIKFLILTFIKRKLCYAAMLCAHEILNAKHLSNEIF